MIIAHNHVSATQVGWAMDSKTIYSLQCFVESREEASPTLYLCVPNTAYLFRFVADIVTPNHAWLAFGPVDSLVHPSVLAKHLATTFWPLLRYTNWLGIMSVKDVFPTYTKPNTKFSIQVRRKKV